MYPTNIRPDIFFVVNTLSWYLVKPRQVHLLATKHVMKYLKVTIDLRLYYGIDHDYILYGYTDSYWVGSAIDMKSTSGRCYCFVSTVISWFSKKQSSVALSTAEAEYIAACSASFEERWFQKMISRLFDMDLDTTVNLCENQSCIKMTNNPVGYGT